MEEVRKILGDDLANYLELLRTKVIFAEELYGVKMNYVPLITEGEIIVLDKKDGKIKWLKTKKPLTPDEFKALAGKIKRNLESGYVEMLLAMNMGFLKTPDE